MLPRPIFYRRLGISVAWGAGLIGISLGLGMVGYHVLAQQSWVDAFLNASMILSGMGPVTELKSTSAKIFAGSYAIYSGIALISTSALIFAPVIHRFLLRFHLEDKSDES